MTEKVKSANEQLSEKIVQYTLPKKVQKALKKRMELNKEFDKVFQDYNMCLQSMICPKCGEQTIRERVQKLAFNPAHQRKDVIEQVLKCTVCDFSFDIPEPQKK